MRASVGSVRRACIPNSSWVGPWNLFIMLALRKEQVPSEAGESKPREGAVRRPLLLAASDMGLVLVLGARYGARPEHVQPRRRCRQTFGAGRPTRMGAGRRGRGELFLPHAGPEGERDRRLVLSAELALLEPPRLPPSRSLTGALPRLEAFLAREQGS